MDCSPPGSSIHGILRARILAWVAIPSSRRSSQPRDRTWVSCTAGRAQGWPWHPLILCVIFTVQCLRGCRLWIQTTWDQRGPTLVCHVACVSHWTSCLGFLFLKWGLCFYLAHWLLCLKNLINCQYSFALLFWVNKHLSEQSSGGCYCDKEHVRCCPEDNQNLLQGTKEAFI